MATNSQGKPTYFPMPQAAYDLSLSKVLYAQQCWSGLVAQFAAENLVMGMLSQGKSGLIATALKDVNFYGTSGSLWEAYNALDSVIITTDMAPFLTTARLDWMRQQMIQIVSTIQS